MVMMMMIIIIITIIIITWTNSLISHISAVSFMITFKLFSMPCSGL